MGQIQYSEKYFDDTYEYRHVILSPEVAKLLPKNRLLSEEEHDETNRDSIMASISLCLIWVGIYLPCYDIFCNYLEEFTAKNAPSMTPYAPLLAGSLSTLISLHRILL